LNKTLHFVANRDKKVQRLVKKPIWMVSNIETIRWSNGLTKLKTKNIEEKTCFT
jgi:hypothetical protein